MISLVFWNYNLLHNNQPAFIINENNNINSLTFNDIINKYRNKFTNDDLAIIRIMKVHKTKPFIPITTEEPYWNNKTKISEYLNFYEIYSNNCDIIFMIDRLD